MHEAAEQGSRLVSPAPLPGALRNRAALRPSPLPGRDSDSAALPLSEGSQSPITRSVSVPQEESERRRTKESRRPWRLKEDEEASSPGGRRMSRRSRSQSRRRSDTPAGADGAFLDLNEERISIGVRLRPQLPFERASEEENGGRCCVTIKPPDCVVLHDPQRNQVREFSCDFVLDSSDPSSATYADQAAVYDKVGARMIDHAVKGFNYSLIAYGQTGTGKTHTIVGDWFSERNKGVLPRLVDGLFSKLGQLRSSAKVHVSYVEIYNSHLRDLFAAAKKPGEEVVPGLAVPSAAVPGGSEVAPTPLGGRLGSPPGHREKKGGDRLKIRSHPTVGAYVENLSEHAVQRPADVGRLVALGERTRRTAATAMNNQSSRSHTVFWMKLEVRGGAGSESDGSNATIQVVDLAGRENEQKTEAVGERFRELTFINRSLFELANCVQALSIGEGHVPFRNSKLTTLLSNSFQNNSRTCLLATLTPSSAAYEENVITCRFLESTGRITTKPIQNVVSPQITTAPFQSEQELQDEYEIQRRQLGLADPYPSPNGDLPLRGVRRRSLSAGGEATAEHIRAGQQLQSSKSVADQEQLPAAVVGVKSSCNRIGESLRKASDNLQHLDSANAKVAASLGRAEDRLSAVEAAVRKVAAGLGAELPVPSPRPRVDAPRPPQGPGVQHLQPGELQAVQLRSARSPSVEKPVGAYVRKAPAGTTVTVEVSIPEIIMLS